MTLAYDAAIYAEDRIAARNLKELIVNITMIAVIFVAVFIFDKRLIAVIGAYVIANLVSLIYAWQLVRGRINLAGKLDFSGAKEAIRLGSPVWLAQLVNYLMLPTILVLLSVSLPGRANENLARIAFFSMAYQMVERTLPLTRSVAFALLPKITDGTDSQAGERAAKASRHTLIASLLIFGVLALFMYPIVALLLGRQYLSIVGAFTIMAPGGVALSLAGVWSTHLLARFRSTQVAWSGIMGVVSALIIAWLGFKYLPDGREVLVASTSVVIGTFVNALTLLPVFCRTGNISIRDALVPGIDDFKEWKRIPGFIGELINRQRRKNQSDG